MYKIVNVADLNKATEFGERDQVVEIDNSRTKMRIATNDYAHKSKSYLSDSINKVDSAFNSYLKAIDKVNSTYFTDAIDKVYLKNGSLIKQSTLNKIFTTTAFLTKDGCKTFETNCISYIDELKNKAVSIIMAQLNKSFIKQNSAGKLSYGQIQTTDGKNSVTYTANITTKEDTNTTSYNFETGEFSLGDLLFGNSLEDLNSTKPSAIKFNPGDAWKDFYSEPRKTYLLSGNASHMLDNELKGLLLFNANKNTPNYRISVPSCSFDFKNNRTIPIAQLVQNIMRRQIKKVIQNVCNKYISKMTSVPTLTSNTE